MADGTRCLWKHRIESALAEVAFQTVGCRIGLDDEDDEVGQVTALLAAEMVRNLKPERCQGYSVPDEGVQPLKTRNLRLWGQDSDISSPFRAAPTGFNAIKVTFAWERDQYRATP